MKRLLVALSLCSVFALPAYAAEELVLTTPITRPSVTKWKLVTLHIKTDPAPYVLTRFMSDSTPAEYKVCEEDGTTAATLASNLNTANLSSNSLQKRALNRAAVSGCLSAGNVAGTPD